MFSSTASELVALSLSDKSRLFNGVSEKPEKASSGLAASNRKNLRRQFLSSTNFPITFPFINRIWRTVTFLKFHPQSQRCVIKKSRFTKQTGCVKCRILFSVILARVKCRFGRVTETGPCENSRTRAKAEADFTR